MVQICRGQKYKARVTPFPAPALKAWKKSNKRNYKKEKENASAGDHNPNHAGRSPTP